MRFKDATRMVFFPFTSTEWTTNGVPAYPADLLPKTLPGEFVKVSVVFSRLTVNRNSASGILKAGIFTQRIGGVQRAYEIADMLSSLLTDKLFPRASGAVVQFGRFEVTQPVQDPSDPSFLMTVSSVTFNYNEVL